jgi:phage FluMu gp28-like protein
MAETLNPELRHVFGMDFARHRHFSSIVPMAIMQNLCRDVPFLLELNNVPSALQQQILFWLIEHLPRQSGGAMDATGPGWYWPSIPLTAMVARVSRRLP